MASASASLSRAKRIGKRLLLTAIAAVGGIRPQEACGVLDDLADSDDLEIPEAGLEATSMDRGEWDEDDEDTEDDEA